MCDLPLERCGVSRAITEKRGTDAEPLPDDKGSADNPPEILA